MDIPNCTLPEGLPTVLSGYCVYCGRKATLYGGHLHHPLYDVWAGLCETCNQIEKEGSKVPHSRLLPYGCYGEWRTSDGFDLMSYVGLQMYLQLPEEVKQKLAQLRKTGDTHGEDR